MKKKLMIMGSLMLMAFIMIGGCTAEVLPNTSIPTAPVSLTDSSAQYKINFPSSMGASSHMELETPTPFPSFPDQIQVYKTIKPPPITPEYVTEIGSKLGLAGVIKEGSDVYSIQVGKKAVVVYKTTGAIEYFYDYDYDIVPKEKPVLPSSDEAIQIATDILNKIGQLPPGAQAIYLGAGESAGRPEDGPDKYRVFTLLIGFKRSIDGVSLTGPGNKYEVRIGNNGEITEILINPIKYEPYEMLKLKSVNQAFQDMQTTGIRMAPVEAKRTIIDNVRLAYWLESLQTGQDYIAPVYIFSGHCLDSSGKQLKDGFSGWAEAIESSNSTPPATPFSSPPISLPSSSSSPVPSTTSTTSSAEGFENSVDIGAHLNFGEVKITYSSFTPKISKSEAISRAQQSLWYYFRKKSDQLQATVAIYSGPQLKGRTYVSDLPVWIILFNNVPETPDTGTGFRVSVFVDATTGDEVYTMCPLPN